MSEHNLIISSDENTFDGRNLTDEVEEVETFTSSPQKVGKPVALDGDGAHIVTGILSTVTLVTVEGALSVKPRDEVVALAPWKTPRLITFHLAAVRDDCTLRVFSDLEQRSSQPRRPYEAFDLGQAIDLEIVDDERHPFRFDLKFADGFTLSASASSDSELKLWIDGLILCSPHLYKKVFQHNIPVYVPQGMHIEETDLSENDEDAAGASHHHHHSDHHSGSEDEAQSSAHKPSTHTDKHSTETLHHGAGGSKESGNGGHKMFDPTLISQSVTASLLDALKSELDHQNSANSATLESLKASLIDIISTTQAANSPLPILADMHSSIIKAREEDTVKSQQQMSSLLKDLASSFATSSAAASASFMREMQADLTRDHNTAIAGLSDEVKKDFKNVMEISKKDLSSVTTLLDHSLVAHKNSSDLLQSMSTHQQEANTELCKLADEIGLQSGSMSQFSSALKEVQSNTLAVGDRSQAAVESIKAVGKSVETALESSKTATLTQIKTISQALTSFKESYSEDSRSIRAVITDGQHQTKEALHSLEASHTGIKDKVADLSRAVETASVHNSASVSAVLAHLQSSLRSQESASSTLSSTVRDSVRTSHDALSSSLSTQLSEALRATRDSLMAQLSEALVREQKASDSRTSSTRESLAEHTVKASELANRVAGLEAASSQVLTLCGRAEATGAKTAESVLQTKHAVDSVLITGVSLSSASIDKLVSALLPRVVHSISSLHEDATKRTNALNSAIEIMNAKLSVFETLMPRMTSISESLALVDSKMARLEALENRMADHFSFLERIDQRSQQTLEARAEADIKAKIDAAIAEISSPSPGKWGSGGGGGGGSGLSPSSRGMVTAHDIHTGVATTLIKQAGLGSSGARQLQAATPYSPTQTVNLDSPSSSSSTEGIAPAFIAQMRALRLQSAALQGELTRLTGVVGSAKLSGDMRMRPEVSAILSRLEQVEGLINETRKAMGGGLGSLY